MCLWKRYVTCFAFILTLSGSAQDHFGYGSSNYGGLNQVYANPAAAADNRLKLDVIIGGVSADVNNSWFAIKREALDFTGNVFKPSTVKLPVTWKNATPNVPDNVFKNFTILGSDEPHSIVAENRILLPSAMYQIDLRNAVAFSWSIRQFGNIDGLSQQVATLFEHELDFNYTQNHRIQNKKLTGIQMTWAEYGFTYARVLKENNSHFFKAGITPKLLQGLQSGYLVINDLDFLFSTKDTSSYFNAEFSYAHSAAVSRLFKPNVPGTADTKNATHLQLGLDLGIIYEWRPDFLKFQYKADGVNNVWRKDQNKYKIRFGASITDLGKIKFKKSGVYYDLDLALTERSITKYVAVADYNELDSLLKIDYPANRGPDKYEILLPAAINTQLDYCFNRFFYLNLGAHIADLFKGNDFRVHNYSAICLAPRFETYWADVSLPLTYNTLSAKRSRNIMAGINMRAGPVSVGTNDIGPWFKGDIAGLSFYAIAKISIPYKRVKDRDGDNVTDRIDECPDVAGQVKGCPDKDNDGIADKEDACPNQPGVAMHKGCPDSDADGVQDAEDRCAAEKGLVFLKGCPDSDNDSIADKDDLCPDQPGTKGLKGCPDSDKDGIADKDDLCPTKKGIAKYNGCADADNDLVHDGIDECPEIKGSIENKGCPWPDSDRDGIIDRLDSCVSIAGKAAYKGCPEPVKMAVSERKILEKAFASLEFESGKDVIKNVSLPSLNALAVLLRSHEKEWKIRLAGHTDNEGSAESNLLLSEKRAKAVKSYLIKKGVDPSNIITEWYGQSRPVAGNSSAAGRKKNRRVEMTMLMKE